jgi:hypothetical protein
VAGGSEHDNEHSSFIKDGEMAMKLFQAGLCSM